MRKYQNRDLRIFTQLMNRNIVALFKGSVFGSKDILVDCFYRLISGKRKQKQQTHNQYIPVLFHGTKSIGNTAIKRCCTTVLFVKKSKNKRFFQSLPTHLGYLPIFCYDTKKRGYLCFGFYTKGLK